MKKFFALLLTVTMLLTLAACGGKTAAPAEKTEAPAAQTEKTVYKVGVCNYVDDASLNQIVENIEAQLTAIGGEKGVTFDYADYYAKMGIKLIDVYATRSTDKNQDYLKALQGDTAPMRAICDRYNEAFIASIATAREGKIEKEQTKWATGKLFFADEALKLGLIDQIDTFENVINYFNV